MSTYKISEYPSSSDNESTEESGEYHQGKRSFDLSFAHESKVQQRKKHRRRDSFHEESSPTAHSSAEDSVEETKDVFEGNIKWAESFDSYKEDKKFSRIAFQFGETSSKTSTGPMENRKSTMVKNEHSIKDDSESFENYRQLGHQSFKLESEMRDEEIKSESSYSKLSKGNGTFICLLILLMIYNINNDERISLNKTV